jgi:hypothetical protein
LQVLDLSGKIVFETVIRGANEWQTETFSADFLSQGLYLTRLVQNHREIGSSKLIK